jgi:formate dehydrogenase subunit delta
MDIEKLVRMANQIAANSDYGPDKEKLAATVADHLTRFWTPEMRAAIIEGHRRKLLDLSPLAASAVEKLVPPKIIAA